jgi:hypothetical protein
VGVVVVEPVEGKPVVEQGRSLEEDLAGQLGVHVGPLPGNVLGCTQQLIERRCGDRGIHGARVSTRAREAK